MSALLAPAAPALDARRSIAARMPVHRVRASTRHYRAAASAEASAPERSATKDTVGKRAPKVIVAGGGIGGLMTSIACKNRGLDVTCYERVQKYKPFGGPLQMAGNALGTLETIDRIAAERIMDAGTITGDRVNGLLDGQTGEWYVRFDTRKPAKARGLPLTTVVNRYTLLDILVDRCKELGPDVLKQGLEVVGYTNLTGGGVVVQLSDGSFAEADVLIGADGIRSRVREQMKGPERPIYSGYTCYTATCDYEAADVETVGYQVFLGCSQYFVSSDLGGGRTQWYAFHGRPEGSAEEPQMKATLGEIFKGWCPGVLDRINATDEAVIERRDISDLRPSFIWTEGSVALLGDSAHAMQPNMGQGACQAIEDAYVISKELALAGVGREGWTRGDLRGALAKYALQRVGRSAAVQGFARSAALMASTYRPFFGSSPYGFYKAVPGLYELLGKIEKAHVPHPGRVVGQVAMMASIDIILDYIAGGCPVPSDERAPYCQLPGAGPVPLRAITDADFEMHGVPGFAK